MDEREERLRGEQTGWQILRESKFYRQTPANVRWIYEAQIGVTVFVADYVLTDEEVLECKCETEGLTEQKMQEVAFMGCCYSMANRLKRYLRDKK